MIRPEQSFQEKVFEMLFLRLKISRCHFLSWPFKTLVNVWSCPTRLSTMVTPLHPGRLMCVTGSSVGLCLPSPVTSAVTCNPQDELVSLMGSQNMHKTHMPMSVSLSATTSSEEPSNHSFFPPLNLFVGTHVAFSGFSLLPQI